MNIGHTIYLEVVRRAERGGKVVEVNLPQHLWDEWVEEGHNINSLFAKLGVVVQCAEVDAPQFKEGE